MRDWLWLAFSRHALIPLLVVETVLVLAYLLSANTVTDRNSRYLQSTALEELSYSSDSYAVYLNAKLTSINNDIRVFGDAVTYALENTQGAQAQLQLEDLQLSAEGVLHNPVDRGGAAIFYPQPQPGQERLLEHVERIQAVEPLMKSLVKHNALVEQVYFNQYDSFNFIYPYFDVVEQYPPDVDVQDFAFFYLADPEHNPSRGVQWTQVYLDPAGKGWLTTATYPIYVKGEFIGAVGFDITIRDLIAEVESVQLPWEGFAMLVDAEQNVIALSEVGSERLGLSALPTELTAGPVSQELNQASQHNLQSYPSFRPLVRALQAYQGVQQYDLNRTPMMVGWSTIATTKWKLLTLVDEATLFAQTQRLDREMLNVVYWMIAGLVVFYILFFIYIRQRARAFSGVLEDATQRLSERIQQIERGDYTAKPKLETELDEVNHLGQQVESMASVLEVLVEQLSTNEQRLSIALKSYGDLVLDYRADDARLWQLEPLWNWLGYSGMPDQLRVVDFSKYIHPEDLQQVKLAEVLDAGQGFDVEFRMRCRDERWLWLHVRSKGVVADHNQVLTVSNIEQRKQSELHLQRAKDTVEQASRTQTQFLAAVVSELQPPLAAIETLAKHYQQQEIAVRSQFLQRLIDHMLQQSVVANDEPLSAVQRMSFTQVVEPALQWVAPLAEDANCEISVVEAQCSDFYADAELLGQVLTHVLFHAIKFSPQPARMYLSCSNEEDSVQMDIRVDSATDQGVEFQAVEWEGRLGVQLCRRWMQLMQGDLLVSSTVDQGVMFTLKLQRA
ncbi:hypothetical protein IDAT_03430 [Pseudidiomarina atlantica]|jgi:signal transduction histidine kinase|uniref:histidine kinase n=2 Tax=Pseudidiomarina atlantica TaxID=1517416 RepID=A0A094IUD1_9GAMM|nr:hypothetical protein IDAT_03430 [Pseudidiomarina atlantica]